MSPKKKASPAQLAGLQKARAARLARLNAEKKAAEKAKGHPVLDPKAVDLIKKASEGKPESDQHKIVQKAIDEWAEAGDSQPAGNPTDRSNAATQLAQADAKTPDGFAELYERTEKAGVGYLQRRFDVTNRSAMVPPACELHKELNAWFFMWKGKRLFIRWIAQYPQNLQQRHMQGYQYFVGREWCERLGLLPEVYLNEKKRIAWHDVSLAWHTEQYVRDRLRLTQSRGRDMREKATQGLESLQGERYINRVQIMEGTDADVMAEVDSRRRFAQARS